MFLAFSGTPAHNCLIVWVAMRIALWKRGGGGRRGKEEGWEELGLEANRKERSRGEMRKQEGKKKKKKEEGEGRRGQDGSGRCRGGGSWSRY